MPFDQGIAQRLRDAGLKVKEVKDWKTRANNSGSNFHPKGLVVHHTAGAGPSAGSTPSLGIIINGRPDLAGPLANIYQGYDDVIYVVAAGGANHAGTPDGGSCKGMHGNSDAWGFEIEHPGTFPLDDKRADIAAQAVAAMIRGTCTENMVVYHAEWAPSRKIDLATAPKASTFRGVVADYLQGGGFLMALTDAQQEELFENSRLSKQFAEGVQTFFEAFKNNGNSMEGLKMPSSVDKPNEIAGWKLAERVQNIRLDTKD
jgi:hypothetical protein